MAPDKANDKHNRVLPARVVVALMVDVSTKAVVTAQKLKWVRSSADAVDVVVVAAAQSTSCCVGVP